MISLTNYDFQWARSELVIIYPERCRFQTLWGYVGLAAERRHHMFDLALPMTDPAGAGILMLTWLGYIDGKCKCYHICLAAPWILWVVKLYFNTSFG